VEPQGPLGGVEKTALGVAMVRAWESRRPGRLFDDPYAQAFVDAVPAPGTRDAHGGFLTPRRTGWHRPWNRASWEPLRAGTGRLPFALLSPL
jgi:hypothetical protein